MRTGGWTLVSTVVNFHFKFRHSGLGVGISCTPKLPYLWGQKKSDIELNWRLDGLQSQYGQALYQLSYLSSSVTFNISVYIRLSFLSFSGFWCYVVLNLCFCMQGASPSRIAFPIRLMCWIVCSDIASGWLHARVIVPTPVIEWGTDRP